MKVTKEMLDPTLQGTYGAMTVLTWLGKRAWFRRLSDLSGRKIHQGQDIAGHDCDEKEVLSRDGSYRIRTRVYRPKGGEDKLPVMLYIHGGGYVMGYPEMWNETIQRFIETRACVVIAPDYRKAGVKPFPAGFDDCYDVLLWARDNADQLGIRSDRFIIAGHSAGGGLTAAVTLKARDTQDVDIAFQMPIYPMIDDQQPADPERCIDSLVWDTEMNAFGWACYLEELHRSGAEIPAYAAPARNQDYQDFPPTITFVGDLEPFYWETCNYVEALRQAGIDVAFEEYKGCYHGFDIMGQGGIADEAKEFTFNQYADFYDRYVTL